MIEVGLASPLERANGGQQPPPSVRAGAAKRQATRVQLIVSESSRPSLFVRDNNIDEFPL